MYIVGLVTSGILMITLQVAVFLTRNHQFFNFIHFQYPELVAASYGENSASDVDPDGVALIWNTKFAKGRPGFESYLEHFFSCLNFKPLYIGHTRIHFPMSVKSYQG